MQEDKRLWLIKAQANSVASQKVVASWFLFDQAGKVFAPGPARDNITVNSVFDWIPGLAAEQWSEIWAQLQAGQAVTLGQSLEPAEANAVDATYFVATKILSAAGDLAAIEKWESEAFSSLPLQKLQQDVLEAVASGWPLKRIMEFLCRRVEAIKPDLFCSVLAVDTERRLRSLAAPSLPAHFVAATDGIPIGPCVGSCGTAAHRGEPVEVSDLVTDPLWVDYKDFALSIGLRACWSSPIKDNNRRVIGTFAFYYSTPRGPDLFERRIVKTCVHLCAIAISHEESRARIHELAFRDPLTHLANRAAFQARASEVMAAFDSFEQTLAIHSIDLDNFKDVNDTLGHGMGDQLLKSVAARLEACANKETFIARLGGDEFAILQYPAAGHEAIEACARKALAIFDTPFEIDNRKLSISASIGIAQAPIDGRNFPDLLKRSDLALYEAKRAGRNQVRLGPIAQSANLATSQPVLNSA